MQMASTLTAREAAERLDISLPTLYAYVSRGLIHSEPDPEDIRQRRYSAHDVQALLKRKAVRKDPASAAEDVLRWGMPLLDSALTLIEEGRLYYRGRDVVALAQTETLERVAALLWMGTMEPLAPAPAVVPKHALPDVTSLPVLGRMQVALAVSAAADPRAYDLRAASMAQAGLRIVRLLLEVVAPAASGSPAIASQLAAAWLPGHEGGHQLLDMALILCADHELNASSFTARVVASAGATPYAVVSAGLAALSGVRHGGMTERVDAFWQEVERVGDAQQVIAQRLQRGEAIPGFGHPLYPGGDPRGAELTRQALQYADAHTADRIRSVLDATLALLGDFPSLDFGLVAFSRALRLPAEAPLVLFALGRTVGWIAHAIEQSSTPQLIRPRARYTGIRP